MIRWFTIAFAVLCGIAACKGRDKKAIEAPEREEDGISPGSPSGSDPLSGSIPP